VAPDTAVTVGGLAEYTLSPAIGAVPVLPELTDRQAAGFPGSFRVAHIGLVHRAAIRPGETLLVLGGSGRTIGALGLGRLVPRYRTNVARGELPVLFLILYGMCLGAGVTGLARAFGIGTHVSFLELTACLALINLAVTASISAVVSIVGSAGAAVGGFLYFLPGSPISGATTAGPLMPAFWHGFGQGLPPGAGATMLRRVRYFPDAPLGTPILTLSLYAGIGAIVLGIVNAVAGAQRRKSLTGLP
jgi:hypothetical protein